MHGIFAGDVGLITHYIIPKGQFYARRRYEVMNPVTANQFTGKWTPPLKDVDIVLSAENQATATSVVFAIELKDQDQPDLIVSNIAQNTFSSVISLDPNLFEAPRGLQIVRVTGGDLATLLEGLDAAGQIGRRR